MFDTPTLLEILVLPTVAAVIVAGVLLVLAAKWPAQPILMRLGGLVIAGAYLAAHATHFPQPDWTNWQAVDAWQWLLPGVVVVTLIAIVDAVIRRPSVRWLLRGLAVGALAAISLQSFMQHSWPPHESALWLAGVTLGGTAWWALAERAGTRSAGNWFALQWLLLTIGCGATFVLSGSLRLLEMAMTLGSGIGVAWVLQMIGRRSLAEGLYAVAPFILLGLWFNAYFYGDATWWRICMPALAPLAAWIGPQSTEKSSKPWIIHLCRTAAVILIVGGTVAACVMMYEPDPYSGY
ncbi:MAG TPA: hypothetical protein VNT79_07240 [Phycisphaerae bacterium]|nr:hypothetical protein [Phycisphaerae bacterium]